MKKDTRITIDDRDNVSTISGYISQHREAVDEPKSPISFKKNISPPILNKSSSGTGYPALRRTALLIRASQSVANINHDSSPSSTPSTWPRHLSTNSRSQSLNLSANPSTADLPPVYPPGNLPISYQVGNDPTIDGPLTPNGLSWRRLHISRAKLKATATTSELLSGFAMIAMVELQINSPTNVPEWLFVLFAICTTVLVAVHIFALMISTYILPNIDVVAKLHTGTSLISESPHESMRWFIELAWAFSTILGLFLFLIEVGILCWLKFWDYSFTAALASTIIVVPSLAIFIGFAVHFYHTLVVHKCEASSTDLNELEAMRRELDAKLSGDKN